MAKSKNDILKDKPRDASESRLFHGFNCRGRKSIFALGVFSNKFSWIAFISGVFLVNAVLYSKNKAA